MIYRSVTPLSVSSACILQVFRQSYSKVKQILLFSPLSPFFSIVFYSHPLDLSYNSIKSLASGSFVGLNNLKSMLCFFCLLLHLCYFFVIFIITRFNLFNPEHSTVSEMCFLFIHSLLPPFFFIGHLYSNSITSLNSDTFKELTSMTSLF